MGDSPPEPGTVIGASGLVLGRLASVVAKRLLSGETIVIVNAENALISGRRQRILGDAKKRLKIRTLGSKRKNPKHPRRPDGIVRRTVRGMLPRDKTRGREAYRRLKVYLGVPAGIREGALQTLPEAKKAMAETSLITVGEVAQSIGWNPLGER